MSKQYIYRTLSVMIIVLGAPFSKAYNSSPLISIGDFKSALNSDSFLISTRDTTKYNPLSIDEIEAISNLNQEPESFFDKNFNGRDIKKFFGDTLVVGGGKKPGILGENQGKTVLINVDAEEKNIQFIINKLMNGQWTYDHQNGKIFLSEKEKTEYIKHLYSKIKLYKLAFTMKNKDILDRSFTLNIDPSVEPDILASILSPFDIDRIPDHRFSYVEFENVPCNVFLNKNLYINLSRITQIGGTISLSISNSCRRIIIPVIKQTKFGKQFMSNLKDKYKTLQDMHPTYHRININLTNINNN